MAEDIPFFMRFGDYGGEEKAHFNGKILVINRGETYSGTGLTLAGTLPGGIYRKLVHGNETWDKVEKAYSASDYGLISAGCFVNYVDVVNGVNSHLKDWGVSYDYDVLSEITLVYPY